MIGTTVSKTRQGMWPVATGLGCPEGRRATVLPGLLLVQKTQNHLSCRRAKPPPSQGFCRSKYNGNSPLIGRTPCLTCNTASKPGRLCLMTHQCLLNSKYLPGSWQYWPRRWQPVGDFVFPVLCVWTIKLGRGEVLSGCRRDGRLCTV